MKPVSRAVTVGGADKSKRAVASPEESFGQNWHALFDVKETPHEITILVDLPGVDEDDIEIEAKNGAVCIDAPREFDHDNEDAEEYTKIERPYGTFRCEVTVPADAVLDEMTAKYKRGVLKVQVPCRRG